MRLQIGSFLWSIGRQTHGRRHHTQFLRLFNVKQIDSILPCVCPVIDHRKWQLVFKTSATHSASPHVSILVLNTFWPHLSNRRTVTWNIYVLSRAWYNLSALKNAIKLIHLVCTYSPELWQSPSSRRFHWKDQFRQTPKHLYGYLTIPTCLRIEIKFSLNKNNFYSKKFKISFRMNDVIFLLRSSSDQLLYNVEQLLSTKKKKLCLLYRAEWRLRMRFALARKTDFESFGRSIFYYLAAMRCFLASVGQVKWTRY